MVAGVWVLDNLSKSYFCWLTDTLPRLIVAESYNKSVPVLLPEEYLTTEYINESIEIFQYKVITYSYREKLKVKELIVPSHLEPCGFDADYIKAVRTRFNNYDGFTQYRFRKVYISRSLICRRKVLNERMLVELLEHYGIECFHMEALSFREQRQLMSETGLLISNHGAGLTNMLFMPAYSVIMELKANAGNVNNCFFNLARALDHAYYYTINEGDDDDVQKANIHVDLQKLEDLLDEMIPC